MKSKRGSSATASAKGKTEWARVRAMKDANIPFTADAPRTSAEDWVDAVSRAGPGLANAHERGVEGVSRPSGKTHVKVGHAFCLSVAEVKYRRLSAREQKNVLRHMESK
jgi:hypothetical protein